MTQSIRAMKEAIAASHWEAVLQVLILVSAYITFTSNDRTDLQEVSGIQHSNFSMVCRDLEIDLVTMTGEETFLPLSLRTRHRLSLTFFTATLCPYKENCHCDVKGVAVTWLNKANNNIGRYATLLQSTGPLPRRRSCFSLLIHWNAFKTSSAALRQRTGPRYGNPEVHFATVTETASVEREKRASRRYGRIQFIRYT
jgi:hypothetical protein